MWVSKTSYMWKVLPLESCYMYFQNGKYLAIILDDSAIKCHETKSYEIETKTVQTNLNEKKYKYKISIFCLHCY